MEISSHIENPLRYTPTSHRVKYICLHASQPASEQPNRLDWGGGGVVLGREKESCRHRRLIPHIDTHLLWWWLLKHRRRRMVSQKGILNIDTNKWASRDFVFWLNLAPHTFFDSPHRPSSIRPVGILKRWYLLSYLFMCFFRKLHSRIRISLTGLMWQKESAKWHDTNISIHNW